MAGAQASPPLPGRPERVTATTAAPAWPDKAHSPGTGTSLPRRGTTHVTAGVTT